MLALSIVLCTGDLRSNATRSAAVLSLDDYEEDNGDDSSSFSFTFPETRPRGLVFGFYDATCPDAEEIVSSTVRRLYHADSNVAAALVRLFFHDCFIHVRPNKPRARLPRRVAVSVTRDAHARTRQDAVSSWTPRAGLRRLGAPGPRRRPQVGAGRGPEPVAARLRRRRGDQAAGGGGVPRDRLLRGHPGPRRAGQPRPGGRAYLPCAHRPPRQRRELLLRSGGGREHPGPERHLRHDARRVRAPRLHRARDRRSLRSACGLQLCTAPCLPI